MLFVATYINAQSEITGFLGIKLEDKPYVAIDKLKKRYPNLEWKHPSITLKNITFIDTKFDNLVITYKNEKLVEAIFTLSYSDDFVIPPSRINERSIYMEQFQSKQNQFINKVTQIFDSLGSTLCSKYGNPTISSKGNAIWRDINSNSITLNVTFNIKEVYYDFFSLNSKLTVTYRTSNTNNDEF